MDSRAYFLIDGSHLFASIFSIWRKKPTLKNKKLNIGTLSRVLMNKWAFNVQEIVRVIYYFKKQDKRLKTMLVIPKADKPGEKDRWQIEECGQSIETIPDSYLQRLPEKYRDRFQRQEKGLDIKLACDGLMLVTSGKASRIVFLVNDRDYIPLFKAIQYSGGNVYLTGLDSSQKPQKELTELADRYLTLDDELESIFGIVKQDQNQPQQILQQVPAGSTSDLKLSEQ